jgi:aminoglycoside phosphotransferase (APT) family kinase protein
MAQRQSTNVQRRQLTTPELDRLRIALGSDFISLGASPLVGGIDTAAYRLDARRENGEEVTMVLRSFRGVERDRSAERVRHERALLDAIAPHFARAPRPLVADPSGDLLGEPLVILTWLPGRPEPPPRTGDLAARAQWIEEFARPLAEIHAIGLNGLPPDIRRDEPLAKVIDGLEREAPNDALSGAIVAALHRLLPATTSAELVLLHHDYWYGNTIWEDRRLTGVVDWSSARLGDPRKDLALARADVAVTLDLAATDQLAGSYERVRGPVGGLVFWDLLWALVGRRSMESWLIGYAELGLPELSDAEAQSRLAVFAERALQQEADARSRDRPR